MNEVVQARAEHITPIVEHARQADVDECWAAGAITFSDALTLSFLHAAESYTWLINGVPVAMGGVRRVEDTGVVWLLGTDAIDHSAKAFLKKSYRAFRDLAERYDVLFNYVDARNTKYIRWLAWMGFTIYDPQPFGCFRRPFHRFEWRRN